MRIALDPSRPEPLFEQVADGVRGWIGRGDLAEGEEVSSVRTLAAQLGVNYHTVARALRLVEDEGLIERQRGGAYRVAVGASAPAVDVLLRSEVERLCGRARALGVGREDLVALVEVAMAAGELSQREDAAG